MKMWFKKIYLTLEILFSAYLICSWNKSFEYSHCDILCYIWVYFYLYICYWCVPDNFEIVGVITGVHDNYHKGTVLSSLIVHYINESWLFSLSKNCNVGSDNFEIVGVITGVCDNYHKGTVLSNLIVHYINESWLFSMSKNCNVGSLV